MLGPNEFEPGTAAPETGTYELRLLLGGRTGECIEIAVGRPLPAAPRGWFWSACHRHPAMLNAG
jgi:hypothetical protein